MLYFKICANEIFPAGPILLASFCGQLVGWAKLSSTVKLLFLGKNIIYAGLRVKSPSKGIIAVRNKMLYEDFPERA